MKKAIQVLGFSAAVLLAAGCSSPDLFGEYDSESFLTRASFQDDAWQLMPDYDFTAEGTLVSDYMDFSLVNATGGPNGGPSYRLEIKNLLANGDFEDGTANGWYHYDGTGVAGINDPATGSGEASMHSGAYLLDGANSLYLSTTALYRVGLVLNNANNANYSSAFSVPATYIDGKNYVFNFNYRAYDLRAYYEANWDGSTLSLPGTSYQYKGGVDGTDSNPGFVNYNYAPPLDPDLAEADNGNVFTADNSSGADTLFFTWTSIQTSYIDNVTIVRDTTGDFDLRLRLKLNLDHRSDLDLIPGYYRFSVYVREEASGTNNVFEADRVELGINGYDPDNSFSYEETQMFYKTNTLHNLYSQSGESFQGDWSSGWVQLIFETDQTIQLPDISENPVMELTISPSNTSIKGSSDGGWNRLDAGSILIAEPSLEYSDGPWD